MADWKTIPGHPKYEYNENEGQVRHKTSQHIVKRYLDKCTFMLYVTLRDHNNTTRWNIGELDDLAEDQFKKLPEFCQLKDYPKYEINRLGVVRNRETGKELKAHRSGTVALNVGYRKVENPYVQTLVSSTF